MPRVERSIPIGGYYRTSENVALKRLSSFLLFHLTFGKHILVLAVGFVGLL